MRSLSPYIHPDHRTFPKSDSRSIKPWRDAAGRRKDSILVSDQLLAHSGRLYRSDYKVACSILQSGGLRKFIMVKARSVLNLRYIPVVSEYTTAPRSVYIRLPLYIEYRIFIVRIENGIH